MGGSRTSLGRLVGAPGRLLASLGPFLRGSSTLLKRSWLSLGWSGAPLGGFFGRPGALWARFGRLPGLIFLCFFVLSRLFCLTNALIAAGNPHWHLLRLFVPPCSAAVRAQHMELEPSWLKIAILTKGKPPPERS